MAADTDAQDATFPLRVAAIDVGSNAIRFLAAEFLQPLHYTAIEQVRTPVRLGHDVFLSGRLTDPAMEAAVEALRSYRHRLDALGVARYRAVATSAVRDSRNGEKFIDRVGSDAGIRLEVITGAEEARLVHQAVRSRVDLGRRRWLLADLGGGSVEISLVDASAIHWSVSHEVGSVRLLEALAVAGDDPARFRRRIEEYTATLRLRPTGRFRRAAGFIATGGNIEALAKLGEAKPDDRGVARLPTARLKETIEVLARLPYRERISELGLREDRADVILPAAMVYDRFAALAGFDTIIVPNVGVKDGVVVDLADDLAGHEPHRVRHDQTVYAGALALGRRYRFDAAHGRHVSTLALSLFDQLAAVHGLSGADRRILMASAILHDIGTFIGYRKHHKHTQYIVSQSELPGFAPREILMVANVARYHRKGEPAEHHQDYMALAEKDRERVRRLAAILRIADALDREHLQTVQTVRARRDDGRVELGIETSGDLVLERWAVQKKVGLFEKTFGLAVTIADDGRGR